MRGETVRVNGAIVDDVLVAVGDNAETVLQDKITIEQGPIADYILYFPESFDEDLTGKTVNVRGIECKVIGHPDHYNPRGVFGRWAGKWDMKVLVKRTLTAYNGEIVVRGITITRDTLGNRTRNTQTIYAGAAQVRQKDGTTKDGEAWTNENTRYSFIFPYPQDLSEYQAQQIEVEYNGKTYSATRIENLKEASEMANIEAVRNG